MTDTAQPTHTGFMHDIAVIGAGIVGVACALQLARQGLRVVLIDRLEPGLGASFGNAGHLATEQVFPIADSSILKRLPSMLLDPTGPLRLDWRYLPRALPWFIRLLLNLRQAPTQRSIAGLRKLNEGSLPAWQRLLASIDKPQLLRRQGSLLMIERRQSQPALRALQARMLSQGVTVAEWDAHAVRQAAPQLSPSIQGGLFFADTGHFIDPKLVVDALFEACTAAGVSFYKQQVNAAHITRLGVLLQTDEGALNVHKVLIACGAHSAHLTQTLTGQKVPLETERGYHLMLPHEHQRLPFPVTSFERKFIMTPMSSGLRLAGTVEFAGLDRPPQMKRAWQLLKLSQDLFARPLNESDASPWMGFRPSLPDSLPVMDCVCNGKVLLAFGHQHLGLTQAAYSAELMARLCSPNLMEQHQALLELKPYRLSRFNNQSAS
ncbi:NAD(P)/FAD-dependent oxidoreductase [Pseudomonas sp. TTU2014-080ASC]|uniref:NAD(P)/FAD-dependent oxidoreductase n=1 Tax=Pseudomonas sp. TTU2014-080ASC TaxID=1729724 RepID=UPI0007188BA2|nr:FAD-dependent oxidoreductase [Pseudomonas sp. TTU2014-080ASC]KRW59501.1 FAD-dependent oxidoreductase [Pseudomonas sp. TTU2014-080ASC]